MRRRLRIPTVTDPPQSVNRAQNRNSENSAAAPGHHRLFDYPTGICPLKLPPNLAVARKGCLYLVGAGLVGADRITLRGWSLLCTDDAALIDALADAALYRDLPLHIVQAGKRKGDHGMAAADIHTTLIELAQRRLAAVRLKGGDPFALSPGSEEAAALAAAGVPCEVVPSVSSAFAAPLVAGIPLTHRGVRIDDPSDPRPAANNPKTTKTAFRATGTLRRPRQTHVARPKNHCQLPKLPYKNRLISPSGSLQKPAPSIRHALLRQPRLRGPRVVGGRFHAVELVARHLVYRVVKGIGRAGDRHDVVVGPAARCRRLPQSDVP